MKPFNGKLKRNANLFIPFIMAGDPSPSFTVDFACMLEKEGADILELGVPYSDPLADGPTIQRSADRALKQGMTLKKAMDLVPQMRNQGLTIPVVLFTYFNPVHQYGEENLIRTLREKDIDGLLIPDLPFEESSEIKEHCLKNNIELISLVSPNSAKRAQRIARDASGFLYAVSDLGVTGERKSLVSGIAGFIRELKQYSDVPVAVGFGISTHDQIQMVQQYADGVIIGSRIIRMVEEYMNSSEILEEHKKQALAEEIRKLWQGEV